MTNKDLTKPRPGLALHWQILIGLAIGVVSGLTANAFWSESAGLKSAIDNVFNPIGQVFLRLIFMVVIPLVFSALVLGVAGMGDMRKLGRVGLATLVYTILLSSTSVAIGLLVANVIQPGARLSPEKRAELVAQVRRAAPPKAVEQARQAKTIKDILLDVIPKNPLQEAVGALDGSSPGGGMLAVMFFGLMCGIGVSLAPDRAGPLITVLEGIFDACMAIIGIAMKLAPAGVAALTFAISASLGLDILLTLGWYVAAVILGLALHTFGVYSVVLTVFAKTSPRDFFSRIREAMLTAFGTASSNATLPTSLRVAEQELGLNPEAARFVLTVGSTANQNGTALYEGITVLFLAQVFNVELGLTQQLVVLLMSVLAGIGTAGVPGGSLPLVVMVLLTIGVPAEGIGIILGVDRLLDMCRTTVNVTGDLVIAACVGGPVAKLGSLP